MPWEVKGKCVYKKGGTEPIKCHNTEEEAKAHVRALYANVKESISELSLYISKSNIVDGQMYWSAVSSDVDWDLYGERMSLELYKSMISKINNKVPPPEFYRDEVTSNYWQGGMPYLSIAHYSDGNGKAVPGEVHKLYVDGKKLKSKGLLFESPLGQAVWKSLKQDEIKNSNDDRIRISIAFIDLAHKHGEQGKIFSRKSEVDVCEECRSGKGEKIYLDGYLVHLALTRVPVNPRTLMEVDIMAKKSKPVTRKEDAKSIVGDEGLVTEIVEATLETKSDVLVEMSEADEEPLVEESKGKDNPEDDEDNEDEEDYKKMSLSDEDIERIALKVKSLIPEPQVEEPVQRNALEVELDNFYSTVTQVNAQPITSEEKLVAIQPALSQVAEVVKSLVKEPVELTPVDANSQVMEAIQSLTNKVDGVINDVATIKAQSVPTNSQRVPVPRSHIEKSNVLQNGQQVVTQPQVNPNSVKNIIRRSVGLQQ